MHTDKRLWRTEKDGELVLDDDPRAVSLAYGIDDEVSSDDESAAMKALGKAADKQAEKAQDKKTQPPENKGGGRRAAKRS